MIPRLPVSKGVGHGLGNLRFGFDNFRAHLLRLRAHFLLDCDGGRAAHFRFRLGNSFVCIGLLALQLRTDVFAHIDIGDVDRKNFESGVAVETLGQDCFEIRSGFSSTSL